MVLDVDAALVEVHSENKEGAASSYKGGYGFHAMFCFADATGEALAGVLRPGNAAANSGADQLVADTGLDRMPFRGFAANCAWLEMVLAGNDLLCWLRTGCLDGGLARAEPKTLRYRCSTPRVASCAAPGG